MASGLLKFKNSLSTKVIPCLRNNTFHSIHPKAGCRTVMNIAFNTGFAEDSYTIEKKHSPISEHHEVVSLKEKEKGDWRKLTVEEKQASLIFLLFAGISSYQMVLYRMSFSQPLSAVIEEPADDWKTILASTFTAMGLMTLGLYVWMARKVESTELFSGPISFQTEVTEEEKLNLNKMKNAETK